MKSGYVSIIECPRDAMQGWKRFIPTQQKIEYINALLEVGFNTIDFGSFVSPKAVPQMSDTKEVVAGLKMENTKPKLLAVVANPRGAEEALAFEQISYLGYPFSISPTFQQRNANSTIAESFERVKQIQELCRRHNRELVIYLSMAFGNPYGDAYDEEILWQWAGAMVALDIKIISLADTVGLATPEQISFALYQLIPKYPETVIGVHLHSPAENWKEKTEAAYKAGCRRFDGALKGIGGCPMAKDELVGNVATERLLSYFNEQGAAPKIDEVALARCLRLAGEIFV